LGLTAHPRSRILHRHLGALGQRFLRAHRRARLRPRVGRVLPAVSRSRLSPRAGPLRPLRARRHRHLARGLPRRLRAALPAGGGAARSRGRLASGSVPRDLPDGALPPGRLQRVVVPAARLADGRGVAALRRAVRAVRGRQPRDSAQLPELALAVALAAALRAGDLPVLSRAGRADDGAAARAHDPRRDERALARRCGRPVGALAMGGLTIAGLDGVTVDAYGTLVTLVDPVPALTAALAERDVLRDREVVVHGFRTEVVHYTRHSAEGHDEAGLARLQRDCARVFLEA